MTVDTGAETGQTVNSQSTPEGTEVDIVGMVEISERLNVKHQTVRQWQQRALLPDPEATVSGVPVWKWSTIERWAKKTGRLTTEESGS